VSFLMMSKWESELDREFRLSRDKNENWQGLYDRVVCRIEERFALATSSPYKAAITLLARIIEDTVFSAQGRNDE